MSLSITLSDCSGTYLFSIQLQREAKDQAAQQSKQEAEFAETRKAHYGAQFDDYQGTCRHVTGREGRSNKASLVHVLN